MNTISAQDIFTNSYIDSIYTETLEPYLKQKLWLHEVSYNAGHFLMLPMHVAFEEDKMLWKKAYHDQFVKFSQSGTNQMSSTLLYRIQYIYLASEYIVLCKKYKEDSLIPLELYQQLYNSIENTWLKEDIWSWKHPSTPKVRFNNMRNKILWKLYNTRIKEKTYHTCILDEEFFLMATAANLNRFRLLSGLERDNILSDIEQLAFECYTKRIEFDFDGSWVIQPGYWSNYHDFKYAGHSKVLDDASMIEKRVESIAEDFSHSLRYPCFINSMLYASDSNSMRFAFYTKVKTGLIQQLFKKIIVMPDDSNSVYRATNYMDGNNGVYRYKYNGRQGGIEPFGLTNSIQVGWWSFLDSKRIATMYEHIALHNGLETLNKYFLISNVNESKFKYLVCILAAKRKPIFE